MRAWDDAETPLIKGPRFHPMRPQCVALDQWSQRFDTDARVCCSTPRDCSPRL